MVREYGPVTLFLTLSCAEYDGLEITTYLGKVNNVRDSYPIGKLCTEDPISVSRKFSQKFHNFFRTVILNGKALGTVAHYFFKKEYQARGAPHYHILLWIDGAPWQGRMTTMWYCSGSRKGSPAAFPTRPPTQGCTSWSPNTSITNAVEANMDLQYIGKSSLAIAQYVTGYVTKAEKSNMQDLWQEVSAHSSVYSKLWSFGIRCLRSRECGLYEASDLLLGDHLCEKSTTIKWIDLLPSHNRKRRLRNHSKLVEIREINADSTDIFEENLVDNFYPERPDDMEEVFLYDFVAEYEKCGEDSDGNSVYQERTKPILPNHRVYDPAKENEWES